MSGLLRVAFVRLATFDRTARGILTDEDERHVEQEIADKPDAAPMIAGTGGVRKIRARLRERGKRGGARVLYLYVPRSETVYLLLAYSKNTRENITSAEKRTIRAIVTRLKEA